MRSVALVIVALVVGGVVGLATGAFATGQVVDAEWTRADELANAGNVSRTVATLRHLREGNTDEAIELLELQLDGALVGLASAIRDDQVATEELHLNVRVARQYREEFPRSTHDLVDDLFEWAEERGDRSVQQ